MMNNLVGNAMLAIKYLEILVVDAQNDVTLTLGYTRVQDYMELHNWVILLVESKIMDPRSLR